MFRSKTVFKRLLTAWTFAYFLKNTCKYWLLCSLHTVCVGLQTGRIRFPKPRVRGSIPLGGTKNAIQSISSTFRFYRKQRVPVFVPVGAWIRRPAPGREVWIRAMLLCVRCHGPLASKPSPDGLPDHETTSTRTRTPSPSTSPPPAPLDNGRCRGPTLLAVLH